MSVPNVKFLTIPLTISLGIALMNCVVYLNNIVKIREEEVDLANEPQQLNSCPEYWVKDTMYIKGENDGGDEEQDVVNDVLQCEDKEDAKAVKFVDEMGNGDIEEKIKDEKETDAK